VCPVAWRVADSIILHEAQVYSSLNYQFESLCNIDEGLTTAQSSLMRVQ
jgi:hypothetical protein